MCLNCSFLSISSYIFRECIFISHILSQYNNFFLQKYLKNSNPKMRSFVGKYSQNGRGDVNTSWTTYFIHRLLPSIWCPSANFGPFRLAHKNKIPLHSVICDVAWKKSSLLSNKDWPTAHGWDLRSVQMWHQSNRPDNETSQAASEKRKISTRMIQMTKLKIVH